MGWTYRVIRRKYNDEYEYGIHEMYDPMPGGTGPVWTVDPMAPLGNTVDELRDCLYRMLVSLEKPVLEEHGYELKEIK